MAGKALEKVKNLRGALYRKIKERQFEEETKGMVSGESPLPGFRVKKISQITEFPKIDDITKVDITYALIAPFVYANIKWSPEGKEIIYSVIEPELTEKEMDIMKKISEALIELVDIELSSVRDERKAMKYLERHIKKTMKDFGIKLTRNQYIKIMYYVYRDFVGFNEIEPFLQDPNIEDISCDGTNTPVYIIHRKFGSLKTNVVFKEVDYLREFIIKMAERCGRYVSYAEPLLAGTLPDGSRVSATLAGDVATRGPTFTIRKFSETPFSPTDQIKLNTASSDILAYFWYVVEHGASLLVVGGVATGKTSFLNTLCMFIPPEAKIVSIEDTRELRISNEHWAPTLARTGFGIPMPTGEKYGGVSLFDLLKESFRQNPDYVIVGETRGKEAYVMFQGMSSGHPSMSTFHAGSVDTVVKRLITPPIELPPTLLESLNVITVMIHAKEKGKSARRLKEIIEIESVDSSGEVSTNVVFRWNPVTDGYENVNESILIQRLVEARGGSLEEAHGEINERKEILDWMFANSVTDYKDVTNIINRYYKEPKPLLRAVKARVKKDVVLTGKPSVIPAAPTLPTPSPPIRPLTRPLTKPLRMPARETFEEPFEEIVKPKSGLLIKKSLKERELEAEAEVEADVEAERETMARKAVARKEAERERMRAALEEERVSVLNLFGFNFVREQQYLREQH